jgi:hypothetical protein
MAPGAPNLARHVLDETDAPCDSPPITVPTVNPCNASNLVKACRAPRDLALEQLASMGREGEKILRARERVLEILQTENACSAWFREKDQNPGDTFQTLSFEVDRKGEEFVVESKSSSSDTNTFRSPYVASVFQADGRYGKITINAKGAFFSSLARMVEIRNDGGPWSSRGLKPLSVGPYTGNTPHARILALLHEFGHIVDLLPVDEANRDGISMHNTNEVLRFCRAEIELKRGGAS